jgi:V8-like Glu-specific endopeptidase
VGTGFFYYHNFNAILTEYDDPPSNGPYLITNKHVVDPIGEESPEALSIWQRERQSPTEVTRKRVPLYSPSGERRWREHPENENIDIAAIPLEFDLHQTQYFNMGRLVQDNTQVSGGDTAGVIGYPHLFEHMDKLPIVRHALISSPYPVTFENSPMFYVDARLNDGMSGSPVLTSEGIGRQKLYEERKSAKLLGVFSAEDRERRDNISMEQIRAQINQGNQRNPTLEDYLEDLEQRIENIEVETGLNKVWHAYHLEDILLND